LAIDRREAAPFRRHRRAIARSSRQRYRDQGLQGRTLPFPDGAIIAAIHWTRVPSEDNNKVLDGPFPGTQSFVIGSRVNVQFKVKDSKKYAASGGWGFADFTDGKPGDKPLHETCFPCHGPAKDHDYVFTQYAP
jgi:cytochrome P460